MPDLQFFTAQKHPELLFYLRRYFIDVFNHQTIFVITATFYSVEIAEIDIKNFTMKGTSCIEYATREEINNFVQKIRTIVDGKFADECTPNYDLIKSFIELNTLFNSKISL